MIKTSFFNIGDDDSNLWECTATDEKTGKTATATARDSFVAESLAIRQLQKILAELSPVSPNWENSVESNLVRQSIVEFCCVDYSPTMAELSV